MQIYLLKQGQIYNSNVGLFWEKTDEPLEVVIKQYSGERTIQLVWETNDTENMLKSLIIPCKNSIVNDEQRIANLVSNFLTQKLLK